MQRGLCMYQQLYKQIIDQAKLQNRQKGQGIYYEWHHIVPEFMFKLRKRKGPKGHLSGDPNHPDNLVLLTFQEHLMCHYYLYEIHKDDRYGYQTGAALQFFFTKAGNGHMRQRNLSEIDTEFLYQMSHLRELGIASISKARKGKMPVVDAVTRRKIGSVSVNHPNVISGEWVHHSKGVPGHNNGKRQDGSHNNNYKGITDEQLDRVLSLIPHVVIDECYIQKTYLLSALKKELTEFKKLSHIWINNHLGGMSGLVSKYNQIYGTQYKYNPYYRSQRQRQMAREFNHNNLAKKVHKDQTP